MYLRTDTDIIDKLWEHQGKYHISMDLKLSLAQGSLAVQSFHVFLAVKIHVNPMYTIRNL